MESAIIGTVRVIPTMLVTKFVVGSWESRTRPDTTDANVMDRIHPYARSNSYLIAYAGTSRLDVTAIVVRVSGGPGAWDRAKARAAKFVKKHGGEVPEWNGVEVVIPS